MNHGDKENQPAFFACYGKQAFETKRQADRVVRTRKKRTKAKNINARSTHSSLEAYRCSVCRQWHLGTAKR